MRTEIKMYNCQCDRCGKESRIKSGQFWGGMVTAKMQSGANVFPGGPTLDLCYECLNDLTKWFDLLNEGR